MSDPVGLIGSSGAGPLRGLGQAGPQGKAPVGGPTFHDVLKDTLREADRLQQDATRAVEDLSTGRRDDLEGVIAATQKADTAFKMVLALRNKMMQAYEEIKQMRV
ncbi:MAG: flagellar hook-basal body complex protein FliE [Phycisphaerales bacterium]|nr:flagellar hook-basal body complex protein FliE [Phycisphaerales bacterium]